MANPPNVLATLREALPPEYSVEDYIDGGGQGAVFRATLNGERIALKVFRPDADLRRLQRELSLLSEIDCPNLVKILNAAQIDVGGFRTTVVAYEYLDGGDLRRLITGNGPPLDANTIIDVGCQASSAIEALWKRRIVHRDVKPANIVRAGDDRYVLVDVGLARHLDLSDITAPGGAPGTQGYKSPEQAKGRRSLTINSDVFSLGVTLYELAARHHPFNRAQHMVGTTSPPPLQQIRADFPEPLCRTIHQMMAIVPSERPANIHTHFMELRRK